MQQVAMKYRMRDFGLQVFKDCFSYEVREDGASPLGASSTTYQRAVDLDSPTVVEMTLRFLNREALRGSNGDWLKLSHF